MCVAGCFVGGSTCMGDGLWLKGSVTVDSHCTTSLLDLHKRSKHEIMIFG